MDVTPLIREDAQIIQSYAGGRFRISGEIYTGPVIVTPEQTADWMVSNSAGTLKEEDFQCVISMAGKLDVLLLGTGVQMQFLPPPLKRALYAQGLSIDPMDTGAACRTYNVLMAEGRRIAAALLPV